MAFKKIALTCTLAAAMCLSALPEVHTSKTANAQTYEKEAASYTNVAETAETDDVSYNKYYYNQLSAQSKKFYGALEEMAEDGTLKKGKGEYDLIANNVLTQAEVTAYVNNGTSVLVSFGAARDAFYLDHPEIFYVDFSQLSISVGTKQGNLVATLGTGRSDNWYIRTSDGTVKYSSEAQVNAAISAFDTKLDSLAADLSDTPDAFKVSEANTAIVDSIEYSFETSSSGYTENEAFIRSAYAAVTGKGVCEGYARSYKALMDKLGVPCVIVQGEGYSNPEIGIGEAHAWNYVQIDEKWYAVDPTWNDTTGKKDSYLFLGSADITADHSVNGVISPAGFEFRYPALYAYNYGVTSDFAYEFIPDGNVVNIKVSYKNLNIRELYEDGKYFALRYASTNNGVLEWSAYSFPYYNYKEYPESPVINAHDYSQIMNQSTQFEYVKFAIIDIAPNDPTFSAMGVYAKELDPSHILDFSPDVSNSTFGNYFSAPFPTMVTPDNSTVRSLGESLYVTATFNEDLVLPAGFEIGAVCKDSKGKEVAAAEVTDIKWSADDCRKVSFKFKPSVAYGEDVCSVYITGLAGKSSNIEPAPITYTFHRKQVVCNRVYGDGRLYMEVFGNPQIVADGDLSVDGWQIDGKYASANQRSQLMLVASKPDDKTSEKMEELVDGKLGADAVLKSSTYEIDLTLCNCVTKIPNGSYMQVGFGFPEGYGPEDAGVTFKVYHYKNDGSGNITGVEEIPCVITEYGIMATVSSFSPFAIVAVDKTKVDSTAKSIYSYSTGNGKVATANAKGSINSVVSGGTVTYTLTADTGYGVDYVLLNGEKKAVQNGGITLKYDELLENNTLEAHFVADSVKAREEQEGIENVAIKTTPFNPLGSLSVTASADKNEVKESDTVTLTATATVTDAVVQTNLTYEWYLGGTLVGEGETLTVENFDSSKAGEYTVKAVCTGANRRAVANAKVSLKVAEGDKKSNAGLIAGLVIVGVAVIAAAGVGVFFFLRSKKHNK